MCADRRCLCLPGLTLCGDACVDLSTDAWNCGACGARCPAQVSCEQGSCGGVLGTLSTYSAFQISGGSPAIQCLNNNEGYPELSAWAGTAGLFAGYNSLVRYTSSNYNWAPSAFDNWATVLLNTPNPTGCVFKWDRWATTSGYTSLNYLSSNVECSGAYRLAVAGGHPDNIDNGLWNFVSVIDPSVYDSDGPAIYFDPAGATFWVADISIVSNAFRLYIFDPCTTGAPGSAGCPLRAGPVTVATSGGHPNVIANPCTNHGIAAYFERVVGTTTYNVKIRFVNPNGTLGAGPYTIETVDWRPNTSCPGGGWCSSPDEICKCTGPASTDCGAAGCMNIVPRVHLSVKYVSSDATCRLALAFDRSQPAFNGQYYFKGRFEVWNVTNESSISEMYWGNTRDGQAAGNDFGATVSLNGYTNNFGFFYYHQLYNNPCETEYRGWVNTTLGAGTLYSLRPFTVDFPTINFPISASYGLGHYVGIIRRGIGGGYLFPSWSEPIACTGVGCTGSDCRSCQGTNYSLRVMGARVLP